MKELFSINFPPELQAQVHIEYQRSVKDRWETEAALSSLMVAPQFNILRDSLSGYSFFTEHISSSILTDVPAIIKVPEPYISLTFVLKGTLDLDNPHIVPKISITDGHCFARYMPAGDHPIKLKTGSSSAFYFSIAFPLLEKAAIDYPDLNVLIHAFLARDTVSTFLPSQQITESQERLLNRLLDYKSNNSISLENEILGIIHKLIESYIRQLHPNTTSANDPKNKLAHAIKDYIKSEAGKGILLQAKHISNHFHKETRTLTRICQSQFNQNLHTLLLTVQMNIAHGLVSEISLSVKDVAYKMGYADQTAFSRAFRKYFGYPPTEASEHPEHIPED